ncbi:MAG: nucleotidyltransferase family protein [Candidatus Coatesbacteria bacterium]|nr:MAG: nucleotidyltransferase family protein [Candidatus Coatesbacteria bacterium]
MRGVVGRRVLARILRGETVDVEALVAARRVYGSWEKLGEALRREKLAALVGYYLRRLDSVVDGEFRASLEALAREVLAANLLRRKLYEDLRLLLAGAGIPVLPLKGVDLAFATYPDPSCRPMSDVDLLVSPDDYRRAAEMLRAEGFGPVFDEPRWWPGQTYTRGREAVDLHWSPAAALPPRRGMASLCYLDGDETAAREEFRLLVSVCHHQNHFFSLPLLYFYETLLSARRVAGPRYWSLARKWSAVRATRFVLALAESFFGDVETAGRFCLLKVLAAPGLAGADPGRGARAAAVYAMSLDNPAAAFAWGFRKPAWAKEVLTRGPLNGEAPAAAGRR